MQFSRESSIVINFILNQLLPPIIRDSKFMMAIPMRAAFKEKADIFFALRENLHTYSDAEYQKAYLETESCNLLKGSDLNQKCKDRIPQEILGNSVLDVGCGRGELLDLLKNFQTTGCDIQQPPSNEGSHSHKYVQAFAESLPFSNNSYDTVLCTHVLEHVRDINKALQELRRVAKSRIIIVVPKERPYKFGFNLHITFFPYEYNLYSTLAANTERKNISVSNLGGDWLYIEEQDI